MYFRLNPFFPKKKRESPDNGYTVIFLGLNLSKSKTLFKNKVPIPQLVGTTSINSKFHLSLHFSKTILPPTNLPYFMTGNIIMFVIVFIDIFRDN